MASLARLLEPLVSSGGVVPADVQQAAARLLRDDAVAFDHVGEQSVTATVTDADRRHRVALGATSEGLASRCDCERGATGLLCPHSLATAVAASRRAALPPD
jgi:hypothetical protein